MRLSDAKVLLRYTHVLVIAAAIVAADAFNAFGFPPAAFSEYRAMAGWPAIPTTLAEVATFHEKINDYVQDHFPPRAHVITLLNALRYKLGYSGSERVLVGRKGWLFYRGGNDLDFIMGSRLSDRAVSEWVEGIRQRVAKVSRYGGHFYCIFPPSKPTIYPEMLPGWVTFNPRSELDQLLDALHADGLDVAVDVRAALRAAKPAAQLYFSFDTHWNANGSELAARALVERIHRDLPDVGPDLYPVTPYGKGREMSHDLARMMGIIDAVDPVDGGYVGFAGEHGPALVVGDSVVETLPGGAPGWDFIIHSKAGNGRTLYVIRDSFSSLLLPALDQNFSTIIATRLGAGLWRQDIIDRYHPDVVVLETLEVNARLASYPLPP